MKCNTNNQHSASTEQDATLLIAAAANTFLATLSDIEKGAVLFDWTNTAQKQRWSNFPTGAFARDGLMWGNMNELQQRAWLALMRATLSDTGYKRVLAQWLADDPQAIVEAANAEAALSAGLPQVFFGKEFYWAAIIGTPSETEPWQWQFGGHHVTINATIVGPYLSLAPSFVGVQPGEYTDASGNTVRPLGDIEDEAFALVNSLDATQRQAAILGDAPVDLLLGPGQDGKVIQNEGLAATQMNGEQQAALLSLISYYTGMVNDMAAAARLAEVKSTLDRTFFAWYGPTTAGSAAYFRVAGPSIVIEYSPQATSPSNATVDPLHIHGIYRDPTNDYGAKYTL